MRLIFYFLAIFAALFNCSAIVFINGKDKNLAAQNVLALDLLEFLFFDDSQSIGNKDDGSKVSSAELVSTLFPQSDESDELLTLLRTQFISADREKTSLNFSKCIEHLNKLLSNEARIELNTKVVFGHLEEKLRLGLKVEGKKLLERLGAETKPDQLEDKNQSNSVKQLDSPERSLSEFDRQMLLKVESLTGDLFTLSADMLDLGAVHHSGAIAIVRLIRSTEATNIGTQILDAIDKYSNKLAADDNKITTAAELKQWFEQMHAQQSLVVKFFEYKLAGILSHRLGPESSQFLQYAKGLVSHLNLKGDVKLCDQKTGELIDIAERIERLMGIVKTTNALLIDELNSNQTLNCWKPLDESLSDKIDGVLTPLKEANDNECFVLNKSELDEILRGFGNTVIAVEAVRDCHYYNKHDEFSPEFEHGKGNERRIILHWNLLASFSKLVFHQLYGLCLEFVDYRADNEFERTMEEDENSFKSPTKIHGDKEQMVATKLVISMPLISIPTEVEVAAFFNAYKDDLVREADQLPALSLLIPWPTKNKDNYVSVIGVQTQICDAFRKPNAVNRTFSPKFWLTSNYALGVVTSLNQIELNTKQLRLFTPINIGALFYKFYKHWKTVRDDLISMLSEPPIDEHFADEPEVKEWNAAIREMQFVSDLGILGENDAVGEGRDKFPIVGSDAWIEAFPLIRNGEKQANLYMLMVLNNIRWTLYSLMYSVSAKHKLIFNRRPYYVAQAGRIRVHFNHGPLVQTYKDIERLIGFDKIIGAENANKQFFAFIDGAESDRWIVDELVRLAKMYDNNLERVEEHRLALENSVIARSESFNKSRNESLVAVEQRFVNCVLDLFGQYKEFIKKHIDASKNKLNNSVHRSLMTSLTDVFSQKEEGTRLNELLKVLQETKRIKVSIGERFYDTADILNRKGNLLFAVLNAVYIEHAWRLQFLALKPFILFSI